MASPLLTIRGLTVSAGGEHLLEGIDLTLSPGTITGLVGHSGAGKSILARAALNLLPSSLAVQTQSHCYQKNGYQLDLPKASPAQLRNWYKAQVTMIFQNPAASLNPVMKVGSQIRESAGHRKSISKDEIFEVLNQVRFSHPESVYKKYPHQLSGGEIQRIMIAQSLISEATLIIADEPTSALDIRNKANILQILRHLAEKLGVAILLISHDETVIQPIAHNILTLENGRLTKNIADKVAFQKNEPILPSFSPVLTIQKLKISYKQTGLFQPKSIVAVADFSLEVSEGEVVALVGESGSGKSSVLNAIAGLVAHKGSIRHEFPKYGIQILFQDPFSSLNPKMTVEEHLLEVTHPSEKIKTRRKKAVAQLLEKVSLSQNLAAKLPNQLSGGQQQRLALARIMAKRPKLILLDEPTSALDHQTKAEMLRLFLSLKKEFNFTYIISSHDISLIQNLATSVVVLKNGKIVEEGPADKILSTPKENYTHQLIFGSDKNSGNKQTTTT